MPSPSIDLVFIIRMLLIGYVFVRLQLAATPLGSLVNEIDADRREVLVSTIINDIMADLRIQPRNAGLTYPQKAYVLLPSK